MRKPLPSRVTNPTLRRGWLLTFCVSLAVVIVLGGWFMLTPEKPAAYADRAPASENLAAAKVAMPTSFVQDPEPSPIPVETDTPRAKTDEEQPRLQPRKPRSIQTAQLAASLHVATDPGLCRNLASELGKIGTEDAIEALWEAAIAKQSELRAAVLSGLDSVTLPEAVTFSASIFTATSEPDVLDAATRLISRAAGPDSVAFLTELYTESGSTEIQRRHIENAVRLISNEEAISALGAMIQRIDQPRLAYAAVGSLLRLGTPAALTELADAQGMLSSRGTDAASHLENIRNYLASPDASTAETDGINN